MKKKKIGAVNKVAKNMNRNTVQETKQQINLRSLVSYAIVTVGIALLGGSVFLAVKQYQTDQLPAIKPLTAGTYAPAQVIIKVKAGIDANAVVKKALAKKQTLYKNKTTGKTVASYDAEVKKNSKNFQKQEVQITQKSLRQIFPKVTISDEVKEKILRRNGAKDPDAVYAVLGMDRWYTVEVDQTQADVPTIIQQLESDKDNVEQAAANGIIKTQATTTTEPTNTAQIMADDGEESPGGSNPTLPTSGQTATCTNPNDPYSCSSGHLSNPANKDQWAIDAVNAKDAWNITKGEKTIIIAILDTGVDFRHPDLRNKIWLNAAEDINHNGCADNWSSTDYRLHYDCLDRAVTTGGDIDGIDIDDNGYIDDINGMAFMDNVDNYPSSIPIDYIQHGTAVAAIAGAETNTAQPEGIASLCWNCTLMPVNIDNGFGKNLLMFATSGIQYAVNNGADILNMSFSTTDQSGLFNTALQYADELGVISVAISGNYNDNFFSSHYQPSDNERVITVGGIDTTLNRWLDSCSGEHRDYLLSSLCDPLFVEATAWVGSGWGQNLTIMAPATEILTTQARFHQTFNTWNDSTRICLGHGATDCQINPTTTPVAGYPDDRYVYDTGTSFAAPIVSGTIGLMLSVYPGLSPSEVRNIITDTATDMTDVVDETGVIQHNLVGWDQYSGYGRLNAGAAVHAAYTRRPNLFFTADPMSITPTGNGQYRINMTVKNDCQIWSVDCGADLFDVKYRIYNAQPANPAQPEMVYEGIINNIDANTTRWVLDDFSYNNALPTTVYSKIDPLNTIFEYDENDNTSPTFAVQSGGVPYFSDIPQSILKIASNRTLQLTFDMKTSTGEIIDYQPVSGYPAGAAINGNTLTWTPTDAQVRSTPYTLVTKAINHVQPALTTTFNTTIEVVLGPSGPYLTVVPWGGFPRDISDGALVVSNEYYNQSGLIECQRGAQNEGGLWGTQDDDRLRCWVEKGLNLKPYHIKTSDLQYIRYKVWDVAKWEASPIARTLVNDATEATKLGAGSYMFDIKPTLQTESYAGCAAGGDTNNCVDYSNASSAATLRFIEQDDSGRDMPATGWRLFDYAWERSWGDWAREAWTGAEGSDDKNGVGLRAWTTGPNPITDELTGISIALIDDSDGKIRPSYSVELHLKSLNQTPVITLDTGNITLPKRNVPVKFTMTATDVNQDWIYMAKTLPGQATMMITEQKPGLTKAEVSWTPGFYDAAGIYDFSFIGADALASGTKKVLQVTVNNKPPVFNDIQSVDGTNRIDASMGEKTVTLSGSDPDGDPITFSTTCPGTTIAGTQLRVKLIPRVKTVNSCVLLVSDGAAVVQKTVTLISPIGEPSDDLGSPGESEIKPIDEGIQVPIHLPIIH